MKKVLSFLAWILSIVAAISLICVFWKDIVKVWANFKEKVKGKSPWFRKGDDIFED